MMAARAETRPTYTEDYRRACEARLVLSWPLAKRRAYLADIERIRGAAAADALRTEMQVQHSAAKSART
jgi:hypothetical protein